MQSELTGTLIPEAEALSVSDINKYVQQLMETDDVLSAVSIRGEISNFKRHMSSGHLYFSLKDEGAVINAVMFRSDVMRLGFIPEDGTRVVAHGRISVYVRDGKYQLYVSHMMPDGRGAVAIEFELLRKKLEAEGLFDISHKNKLPEFPMRIGVITSPTGAAVRDIINVTGRRFPAAKLYVYSALVQGEGAPESLVEALNYFEADGTADVIIIGRGGGSCEDLWAFNDERVARTIYSMKTPVISAVGHESDFTICDFVADKRAPTPSTAAEMAVPDINEIRSRIDSYLRSADRCIKIKTNIARDTLRYLSSRRCMRDGGDIIVTRQQRVDSLADKAFFAVKEKIGNSRLRFKNAAAKADALSPLKQLGRGYAIVRKCGNTLRSISDISVGDNVEITFKDGEVAAEVSNVIPK